MNAWLIYLLAPFVPQIIAFLEALIAALQGLGPAFLNLAV